MHKLTSGVIRNTTDFRSPGEMWGIHLDSPVKSVEKRALRTFSCLFCFFISTALGSLNSPWSTLRVHGSCSSPKNKYEWVYQNIKGKSSYIWNGNHIPEKHVVVCPVDEVVSAVFNLGYNECPDKFFQEDRIEKAFPIVILSWAEQLRKKLFMFWNELPFFRFISFKMWFTDQWVQNVVLVREVRPPEQNLSDKAQTHSSCDSNPNDV